MTTVIHAPSRSLLIRFRGKNPADSESAFPTTDKFREWLSALSAAMGKSYPEIIDALCDGRKISAGSYTYKFVIREPRPQRDY